jgi:hypothetical protein
MNCWTELKKKNQTSPTSRGCNFLASSPFLTIFSLIDVQRGGLHLLFEHHKQWAPTEENSQKPYLKCTMTSFSTLYIIKTGLH